MQSIFLWPLAEQISKSDSYVANHQGLTERCFWKQMLCFQKPLWCTKYLCLSHEPMLYALHNTILSICQVTMSFSNASVCRSTIPVAGRNGCIDNGTNSLISAELTQACAFNCLLFLVDYLFFMVMWGKNIGGMHGKTEIPAATILIPIWAHWILSSTSHCHRMWSLNVWRSFLSL